jgi:curved DNA-binding protein CbpA
MSGTVTLEGGADEPAPEAEEPPPREETPPEIVDEPSPTTTEVTEDQAEFSERQLEERRHIRRLSEDVTRVDHYRALGLRPDAKPNEIKDAWNNIQLRYDPEKRPPHLSDMEVHMERIVERGRAAYDVLSVFTARKRYDEILDGMERQRAPVETKSREQMEADARKELVEANIKRADELIKEDELYLAIQLLERACALDPRPDELLKLARLLQRNPLWVNRALACMRRAIEADPRHVASWLELAEFWQRRKHAERQRKSLERVLAIEPDNEKANRMYKDLVGSRELQRLLRRARQMG